MRPRPGSRNLSRRPACPCVLAVTDVDIDALRSAFPLPSIAAPPVSAWTTPERNHTQHGQVTLAFRPSSWRLDRTLTAAREGLVVHMRAPNCSYLPLPFPMRVALSTRYWTSSSVVRKLTTHGRSQTC